MGIDLSRLSTEGRNERTRDLDQMGPRETGWGRASSWPP